MSIRWKLLVVVLGTLSLAIVANTLLSQQMFKKHYADAIKQNAETFARNLKLELDRLLLLGISLTELSGFEQQCRELRDQHPSVAYAVVEDIEGRILFSSVGKGLDEQALAKSLPVETAPELIALTDDPDKQYYEASIDLFNRFHTAIGRIRIGIPQSIVQSKLNRLQLLSVIAAGVVLAACAALLAIILRRVLATPLEQLATAMRAFAGGSLEEVPILGIGTKDELAQLSVTFNEMINQLTHARAQTEEDAKMLENLALFDPITHLPNRSHFLNQAESRLEIARRDGSDCCLLFIDLDRFKIVNDTRGHLVGDQLLKSFSIRMRAVVGAYCLLARLSGDEFVVLLEGVGANDEAAPICRKILGLFERPFVVDGQSISVSASIGVTFFPAHANDVNTLLACADMAMYQAKTEGRNDFRFFTLSMKDRFNALSLLENRLRKAIEKRSIEVHFQPKYTLLDQKISGFEALARWSLPELGKIDTGPVIDIAEESGLIIPFGELVRRTAIQCALHLQRYGKSVSVAVNTSVLELMQQDFAQRLIDLLDSTGFDPSLLELEITENVFQLNASQELKVLRTLRDAGIKLAIDDFGTGFSSLHRLQEFPVDTLKIDRCFIARLGEDAKARAVVSSIVDLGHNLGMEVIAEGVETLVQLQHLVECRADQVQGNLFQPALPIADAHQLLQFEVDSESPMVNSQKLKVVGGNGG